SKSALARYSAADFIAYVESHGIAYHEREHGQLFCDDSAKAIVAMLVDDCRTGDVVFALQHEVKSLARDESSGLFTLRTQRESYQAPVAVVATGGLSIPKMGATNLGLKLAEQFGCPVATTRASLVPFTFSGALGASFKDLAGIALPVTVRCRRHSFSEAMLFTHRGASGPALLQISSYWQPGDSLDIDLLPALDVSTWLSEQRGQRPGAQLVTALATQLPKRLAKLLCEQISVTTTLKAMTPAQMKAIGEHIHHWQIKPSATEGYRTAEATAGGVSTKALSSSTMMVKHVPSLYFIGEVVDVTGQLGGFNFQWAWSSAYCAAKAIKP
ncbi:MAG: aminoacetone oxidase family FAD-binding enzyme, partial [Mariprofundaceae bacterium]|nr:aminoacetone oxidase family FAD-binding enzyme [Mariprofundaceae bacterium]